MERARYCTLSALLGDVREMRKKLNPTKGVTPVVWRFVGLFEFPGYSNENTGGKRDWVISWLID